jgi:hypothetical protein
MLEAGRTVAGLDNINDYDDVRLKKDRLFQLGKYPALNLLGVIWRTILRLKSFLRSIHSI